MSGCLDQSIRIVDLARAVNLSASRFTLLFRAETGLSPARYLQALRLEEARTLIQSSFLSVKEVMARVGFNDPSHFTRSFVRQHGVAPSRLRTGRKTAEDVLIGSDAK